MSNAKEKVETEITSENFRNCIVNALSKNREEIKNECEKLKNKLKSGLENKKQSKTKEIENKLKVLNAWSKILQDLSILKENWKNLLEDSTKKWGKQNFFSGKCCPDQYVRTEENKYTLEEICKAQLDFLRRTDIKEVYDNRIAASPVIILILESPHTDEFEQGEPVGPAMGATGVAIHSFLLKQLDEKYKSCRLLLMNAIQFQCSLGVDTKIFRDHVFREVWNDKGKENFKSRLNKYLETNPPEVVLINACTQGKNKKNPLYFLVEATINEVIGERHIKHYRITHPSRWHWKRPELKIEYSTPK